MKANSWLYHYYMVQSRLQYNLAYGHAHPHHTAAAAAAAAAAAQAGGAAASASLAAAIYAGHPQMMHMIPGFGGFDSAGHPIAGDKKKPTYSFLRKAWFNFFSRRMEICQKPVKKRLFHNFNTSSTGIPPFDHPFPNGDLYPPHDGGGAYNGFPYEDGAGGGGAGAEGRHSPRSGSSSPQHHTGRRIKYNKRINFALPACCYIRL